MIARGDTYLNDFGKVKQKSLREVVHDSIRDAIVKGNLRPGERIVESRIARSMGVSQAPVREAIRELEQAGLVVSYPNRGAFVRELTPKDIREIYSLRAVLERFAVEQAVRTFEESDYEHLENLVGEMVSHAEAGDTKAFVESDYAFHAYICKKSGHELLYKTWEGISPWNWTFVTALWDERPTVELAKRHIALVEALKSSDPEVAGEVMYRHIHDLVDDVSNALEKHLSGGEWQHSNA